MQVQNQFSGSSPITGWPLTWWSTPPIAVASTFFLGGSGANQLLLFGLSIPARVTFNNIIIVVGVIDAVNLYSVGLYNRSGTLICSSAVGTVPTTGTVSFPQVGRPFTIPPGLYYLATTGNSGTATAVFGSGANGQWSFLVTDAPITTTGGVLAGSITPPADSITAVNCPAFALST